MQPLKPDYRTLARLAIYIAMLLVVGAILAPPVFFAAQSYIKANPDNAVSRTLASKELPSYFSRCAMLAAYRGHPEQGRALRSPPMKPERAASSVTPVDADGSSGMTRGSIRRRPRPTCSTTSRST